jgi:ribosomal protein L37AE/L43A
VEVSGARRSPRVALFTGITVAMRGGFETSPRRSLSRHRSNMIPECIKHFTLCPSCGKAMQALRDSEIYECRECRVFINEAVRQGNANNNTSAMERPAWNIRAIAIN